VSPPEPLLHIRFAGVDDLPALLEFSLRLARSADPAANPDAVFVKATTSAILRSLAGEQGRIWLMETAADPPRIAATLRAEIRLHADGITPFGYVSEVFVEPEFRRRGLMRLLLEKARDYIAASGAAEIRLETHLGHAVAEAYWRHLGFQPYRTLWRRGI
jgi:GNAT superfamily N-acetyltransferase